MSYLNRQMDRYNQWINWPDQLIHGRENGAPIPHFYHVNVEHDMTETVGFWGSQFHVSFKKIWIPSGNLT